MDASTETDSEFVTDSEADHEETLGNVLDCTVVTGLNLTGLQ